ncbi:hypothetical protein PR202_ga22317 [Eleusine coracana subsp. coracana]|uniref:Uncharacterized protein n=1 Tax=Eleusine coracana subsp. coracana TaxID=191504 RepID=A0AAV5D2R7_ELECO|nr:hypothetical protein PR202_ga22317 [Eleusine coracana subsp. coracana]
MGRMSNNGGDSGAVVVPHLAMLATPGMGHLIPMAELAKRLTSRHGITATLFTFASTSSSTQRRFPLPPPSGPLRPAS